MQSVLNLSIVSFFVVAGLSATIAQAGDPVCGTLKECNELKGKVEARIQELLKTTPPHLGDIVKKADGSVWTMNQYDAEKYCKDQGLRLPTARELALYSQSLGVRGLRETAHSGVAISDPAVQSEKFQMKKDGYYEILTKNAAGETAVDFYFNYSDYKRPAGDLGNYFFWSSSVHPYYSDRACLLSGGYGYVVEHYRNDDIYNAVRCVR